MKGKLALITAFLMLFSSVTVFGQTYSDMPQEGSTYYEALTYAINNKLINGADGKINPDANITKAEAVTIIMRAKPSSSEVADISKVSDVKQTDWYYESFAKAVKAGIVSVYDNNLLEPAKIISSQYAYNLVVKAFGDPNIAYAPLPDGDKPVTRAMFISWLYSFIKPAVTQTPTQNTENASEYSDIKAQLAQEAMQLALGILPDGTSYNVVSAFQDFNQTDWAAGSGNGYSSSGSSSSSGNKNDKDDDEEETSAPTQAPTENETQAPVEDETQAPTEAPTEAEPTYGEYDGPIDNDKDNVVEDPFDDGWRPPGYVGGEDDDNDEGGNEGGFDGEDEDFIIGDGEDDDSAPTEPKTEATQPETEATEPETEATQPETEATEPETEATQPETEATEPETEATQPETEVTEPETEATQPETEVTKPETGAESETDEALPKDEETDEKVDTPTVSDPDAVLKNEEETVESTSSDQTKE